MPDDANSRSSAVTSGDAQASSEACARRLDLLIKKCFGDLQFLSDEFSKLEMMVAPESSGGAEDSGSTAETELNLGKLRFFTNHVRLTMTRMRDARSGRDPLSMPQLILLEEHIATSIAPVKERLVGQLSGSGNSGGGSSSSSSVSSSSSTTTSIMDIRYGVGAADGDERGIHSAASRTSSVSSGMDGCFGGESPSSQDDGRGGGGVETRMLLGEESQENEWAVGIELSNDDFGNGGSVSLGLLSPAPTTANAAADRGVRSTSSSSSSVTTPASGVSSFSRLCWSGVGGVDVVAGVGGGRVLLEQNQSRRDHLDMLSQLEAEGVFAADDSYSPCGAHREIGTNLLGVDAFSPLVIPGRGRSLSLLSPSSSSSPPPLARGVFGGQGEIILSPFPLKAAEREAGAGGAPSDARSLSSPVTSVVKQEMSEGKYPVGAGAAAVRPAAGAGAGAGAGAAVPVCSAGAVPSAVAGAAAVVPGTLAGSMTPSGIRDSASREMAAVAPKATVSSPTSSGHHPAADAKLEGSLSPTPAAATAAAPFLRPKSEPVAASSCATPTAEAVNAPVASTLPSTATAAAAAASAATAAAAALTARSLQRCSSSGTAAAAGVAAAAKSGEPTAPIFSAGGDVTPSSAMPQHASAAVHARVAAASPVETQGVPPFSAAAGTGASSTAAAAAAGAAGAAVGQPNKAIPSAGESTRGGMLLVPPRPAKRRRSSALPAALLQPREVRYQCVACSQYYAATVTGNPWWLLVRQECPACHKMQIPRVDILNPTNNVEGHIAFLTEACAETGSDCDGSYMDWDGDTSDDNSGDEFSGDERFATGGGVEGTEGGDNDSGGRNDESGPSMDSEQAAKLLVLMCHARGCPGDHRSARLAEVCRSVKFLMLHLRDCDGRTAAGQPCPMPWCKPCTALLHHLVQCPESAGCQVSFENHLSSRSIHVASAPLPASCDRSPSPLLR
ncbi:unnamed protein product, partial [Pylaiella littoralis]